MTRLNPTTALALVAACSLLALAPAHAAQVSLFGGSNPNNLNSVTGTDAMGDKWETHNGPLLLDSSFGMSDHLGTAQSFNPLNFSNGLGNFVTSFQLTINNSQNTLGFSGVNTGGVASGLSNHFTVMTDVLNPSTWIDWDVSYNLIDSGNGLFQQILFTAPIGTRLNQGVKFAANVNFKGIMTNDSGWAASWSDRPNLAVPEPTSLSIAGLGLLALVLVRRKTA